MYICFYIIDGINEVAFISKDEIKAKAWVKKFNIKLNKISENLCFKYDDDFKIVWKSHRWDDLHPISHAYYCSAEVR